MWLHVTLFFGCLVLVGLASAAQSAFGYLNAARLRHLMQQGVSRSQAMFEVVHNPGAFLSSVALLYMLSVAGVTAITFDFVQRLPEDLVAQAAAIVGAALLVLLAQTFARGLATIKPEPVAILLYRPLQGIGVVTLPVVRPLFLLTDAVLRRALGVRPEDRLTTSEEDLRVLVDTVGETEALEDEEREMITSIFEMSDRDVRQIMVPRVDVVSIEASEPVATGVDLLVTTGHSRVPVCEGDLDHVTGMVHLRDLTEALRAGRDRAPIAELVRPVHIIPETKKIDELLHEFQQGHFQIAVVVDEYGGTAGVVTIEDLLEEIVGEIRDEYDADEEELIQPVSEQEAIMDARVSIHDANEALPLHLDADDYETVGGLVYERLGKVPTAGDVVTLGNCTIRVLSTKGNRIQRVHVTMSSEQPLQNGNR